MKKYPLVVIGAGAGGLVIAMGAARAGKKVLLIERGNYGGDCTNFGCIPSKSLIASAHAAHALKEAKSLGIDFSLTLGNAHPSLERTRSIVAKVRFRPYPTYNQTIRKAADLWLTQTILNAFRRSKE